MGSAIINVDAVLKTAKTLEEGMKSVQERSAVVSALYETVYKKTRLNYLKSLMEFIEGLSAQSQRVSESASEMAAAARKYAEDTEAFDESEKFDFASM